MTDFGEFARSLAADLKKPFAINGEASDEGLTYDFGNDLPAAIDVALGLGRPLLVTGEPGSGKTTLGYAVARKLGIERAYLFVTKSTSEARDLFYRYDALGRFRDAQAGEKTDAADYLAYQALGAAILDAHQPAQIRHLSIGRSHGWRPPDEPCRSLVVIDEIDKAARDFANDILVEIEKLQFDVPELTTTGEAGRQVPRSPLFPDPKLRPVVVVTSNAERPLPDAFLRRCVYVEAVFPDDTRLKAILDATLKARLGKDWDDNGMAQITPLLDKARTFRADPGVIKRPGLSEMIDAAIAFVGPRSNPVQRWEMAGSALAKTREDRERWAELVRTVGTG